MAASSYRVISKEVENQIFRDNGIFRQTCFYKQSTLTKQSSGIVTFLCKYDIVISDTLVGFFLDVLFLSLYDYHSFMRNKEGIKIELLKKYTEEFV